jgi:hypothetical protein
MPVGVPVIVTGFSLRRDEGMPDLVARLLKEGRTIAEIAEGTGFTSAAIQGLTGPRPKIRLNW